jgi:hypothetical protein
MRRFPLLALGLILASCGGGGGGSSGGSNPPEPVGTTVTFTFSGNPPVAAALATGTGAFTTIPVASNALSFVVPAGTVTYTLALACAPVATLGTLTQQTVYALNLTDGTSFGVEPCYGTNAVQGAATGTFDVTAIPGATKVSIVGDQGLGGTIGATSGSFSESLPVGTNDVAVVAENASNQPLAVKIVRNQTVPGPVNGGSTIVVTAADATVSTPVTISNFPPGFSTPPALNVEYLTSNGTSILLANSGTSFPAISLADTQANDAYSINSNSSKPPTFDVQAGTTIWTNVASSPSLAYPNVWTYAGPAPAAYPTFSYAYAGFGGASSVTYYASVSWQTGASAYDEFAVNASAAYLGANPSIALPNLTGVSGFFGAPASGTPVNWVAAIDGGSYPVFRYPNPTAGSLSYVQNTGTYVEP